jgi:hypothetical protein
MEHVIVWSSHAIGCLTFSFIRLRFILAIDGRVEMSTAGCREHAFEPLYAA